MQEDIIKEENTNVSEVSKQDKAEEKIKTGKINWHIDALNNFKDAMTYLSVFVKWVIAAVIIGVLCGVVGAAFHRCVEFATEIRIEHSRIIWFMPFAGIGIMLIYKLTGMVKNGGTNNVISSVRTGEYIPMRLAPVIFITTVITHLFGGSAGREGAALQLGGSIGYQTGRFFKMSDKDKNLLVVCGMSGVFAALFGTPVTAAIFSIEVISVGVIYYSGFMPALTCGMVAYGISLVLGSEPTRFALSVIPDFTMGNVVTTALISAAAALVSILFCVALKQTANFFKKYIKNEYLRPFVGGIIIILLTAAVGTYDYNGSGVDVINRAVLGGTAVGYAFLFKILFTAVTIGSGFRGGEIVPTMFIGATFGCAMAGLLGFEPTFGAAIGITAMFCGVVNCPMASMAIAVEMFGGEGVLFFAVAVAVSYVLSGYYGLYSSQKIMYSKLHARFINRNVNH